MNLLTLGLFSFGGGAPTTTSRTASPAASAYANKKRTERGDSGLTGMGKFAKDLIDFDSFGDPDAADPEVEEAKRKERELARRRGGRSGTILTGPSGLDDSTDKKTLLGG